MSRRVDDEQAWDFYFAFERGKDLAYVLLERFYGEEACAYVLCYAACFCCLHACLANFVQEQSLASVHVTENAHDWLADRHLNASLIFWLCKQARLLPKIIRVLLNKHSAVA